MNSIDELSTTPVMTASHQRRRPNSSSKNSPIGTNISTFAVNSIVG